MHKKPTNGNNKNTRKYLKTIHTIPFNSLLFMTSEQHPLKPFLPENARILMLGSFPPPHVRWSMEWFYPNFQNDMWRIWGYIATGDKNHFIHSDGKRFDQERIEVFCHARGIALYDTAEEVIRLKNNASDNFLQIVRPTDITALLEKIPTCHAVAATGQKAAETLQAVTGADPLAVGGCCEVEFAHRRLTVWRMPSSSRAYPRSVEWKAEFYRKLLP